MHSKPINTQPPGAFFYITATLAQIGALVDAEARAEAGCARKR